MRFKLSTILWVVVIVSTFFASRVPLRRELARLSEVERAVIEWAEAKEGCGLYGTLGSAEGRNWAKKRRRLFEVLDRNNVNVTELLREATAIDNALADDK